MQTQRWSHPMIALVIASLVIITGCSDTETPSQSQTTATHAAAAPPVVTGVQVATVALATLPEMLEAVGMVRSRKQSILSSRLVARVTGVSVQVGERVKAGQLLVTLDDAEVQTQLHKATAGLREAEHALEEVERSIQAAARSIDAAQAQDEVMRATFHRYAALLERGLVASQAYDEIAARQKAAVAELARAQAQEAALLARKRQGLARIEQARADLASTQVTLDDTRITAPMAGIIAARPVEVGSLASPGVLICILEEERYRLEASVQETDGHSIGVGQHATVHIEALHKTWSSTVGEVVPTAEPLSHTFTVKLDLPVEPMLKSGLFGKASFRIGQRQALLVPRQAVVERGQLQSVFVVDADHIAHLRLVKTGQTQGTSVEILSGLHAGERLVIDGVEKVTDGSRVEGEG